MSTATAEIPVRPRLVSASAVPLMACGAAVTLVAAAALAGFPTLRDAGSDNDSLMRLVQVRDLLAGQSWFDPVQHRMGLPGGFAMHWSRLVDAPLGLLVLAVGETAALVLWPALLFATALTALVVAARLAWSEGATLPALAIGGLALAGTGLFQPGAIDHHNLQVALCLVMTAALLQGGGGAGLGAGSAAALLVAVAAEGLPIAAAGGLVAAGLFLFGGRREAPLARGFGAGFAATGAAAFAATVPPSAWSVPACDAYSVVQGSVAVLAGVGLAAATLSGKDSPVLRAVLLAGLGAVLATLVAVAFPQCLADPYATLDPRLNQLWLGAVTEAQSLPDLLRHDRAMVATWYATPALALVLLAWRWARRRASRADAIAGTLLAAAFLVSLWQVRGALFALPLAALVLAGWVARSRARQQAAPSAGTNAAMALAWLLSFNVVWASAGGILASPPSATRSATATAPRLGPCTRGEDYRALAALPPTTVLSVSNLGSALLAHTPHRALAGPYHRNDAGNLAVLDMLTATPDAAQAMVAAAGVALVAVCPGNAETRMLAGLAPAGLIAGLAAGRPPAWLEPVGNTGAALRLYRPRQPG